MKRLVLVILLLALPVFGQTQVSHAYAYVDIPASRAIVSQGSVYFAGWAFNCNGVQPKMQMWVWDEDANTNGGGYVPWPVVATQGLYRPDVGPTSGLCTQAASRPIMPATMSIRACRCREARRPS